MLLEEDLAQLVDFPTHVKGNILDLIITNCPDKIISITDEGRIGKSDHCIIKLEMRVNMINKTARPKRPNWSKVDIPGLMTHLCKKPGVGKYLFSSGYRRNVEYSQENIR